MVELTVQEENEVAKAKRLAVLRDRARAFRELFSLPQGKIVMDALNAKFSHSLPPNVLDNNGRTDEYQTWRRLGHFDVLEYIKTQLEWKETEHVNTSSSSS